MGCPICAEPSSLTNYVRGLNVHICRECALAYAVGEGLSPEARGRCRQDGRPYVYVASADAYYAFEIPDEERTALVLLGKEDLLKVDGYE